MKRGIDRVTVLDGGFDAWLEAELPTQRKGSEWRVEGAETAPGAPPSAEQSA